MEQEIINTILTKCNVQDLSYYPALSVLCAITHFLDMNDYVFNKKRLTSLDGITLQNTNSEIILAILPNQHTIRNLIPLNLLSSQSK